MFVNLDNETYAKLSALARDRGELTADLAAEIIRDAVA